MKTFKKIGLVGAVAFALFAFNACSDDSNSTSAPGSSGESYAGRTVTIGNQVWMAENLNIETEDSWCYKNDPEMCAKYGRYYTWGAAMKACPSGWHLPSNAEWNTLFTNVGGLEKAGSMLKSNTEDWNNDGKGEDLYGFAVLPAGYLYSKRDFDAAGERAFFWSSSEDNSNNMYSWRFEDVSSDVKERSSINNNAYSVRCVKN